MILIQVPRPPKEAMNPNRLASSLLMAQVEHMHVAEKRLPLRYRTDTYVNAIRTEREAAEYIREVTGAIHRAHEDAVRRRTRPAPKRTAAVAEEKPTPKRTGKSKGKRAKTAPNK
jgi:hypothetical protein